MSVAPVGRKITRSRADKVFGGVCGGLGRHFDLDPVIFRVPVTVLSLIGGLGLVWYGIAWLLIPAEGERENEARRLLSGRIEGSSLTAALVALVGGGLSLVSLGSGTKASFSVGLAAAVFGAAYWSQRRHSRGEVPASGAERRAPADPTTSGSASLHTVPNAPPETQAPPTLSAPSWWREPVREQAGAGVGARTGYLWGPDSMAPYGEDPEGPADSSAKGRYAHGPYDPRGVARGKGNDPRPERPRSLDGVTFLLACLAASLGTSLTWSSEPLSASLAAGLGCALAVFGLGLAASAFRGRTGGGTLFGIILAAALLVGTSVMPDDISSQVDERRWAPTSVAEVRDRYAIGSGQGELDLTDVRVPKGRTERVETRVGAGQLRVLVPEDMRVRVEIKLGLGSYRVPGDVGQDTGGGFNLSLKRTLGAGQSADSHGTLRLVVDVGVGDASVLRLSSEGGGENTGKEATTR
ncbi:hypothetical protein AN216_04300 [Streptomyces oceani]|uniref:Phage shock protein PspC N-terminal domain-containing protein n=1 Tax=Streptomyces oceani TaxID=1075402 RepID=A0A1E7KMR6_9ACTN|nr:hypothetical protein AN216_04300 [Streptomyces oceani]